MQLLATGFPSGEFLHHDPIALDFVQTKLDRRRCLCRRHIGGFNRAEDFTLAAKQDNAPAATLAVASVNPRRRNRVVPTYEERQCDAKR